MLPSSSVLSSLILSVKGGTGGQVEKVTGDKETSL